MFAMQLAPSNRIWVQSKGWQCVDTRGRFLPARLAGLVHLLDDSLSLQALALVCV